MEKVDIKHESIIYQIQCEFYNFLTNLISSPRKIRMHKKLAQEIINKTESFDSNNQELVLDAIKHLKQTPDYSSVSKLTNLFYRTAQEPIVKHSHKSEELTMIRSKNSYPIEKVQTRALDAILGILPKQEAIDFAQRVRMRSTRGRFNFSPQTIQNINLFFKTQQK